jgi:acetyl esterase/lipase
MKELLLWPNGAPLAEGFSDEDCPAITPYLAEGENRPVIIVCPGGGYGRRAHHEGEPVAKWLNSLGISAFVLRYRVAPYQYPCALLDVQRAIRTVRHEAESFRINPDKIGVLGFSAGGHLAANAGTSYDNAKGNKDNGDEIDRQSAKPNLLVLCYPVITMKDPFAHTGSRENLLGKEPELLKVEQLSTELNVTRDTPPTFLWHTSDDAGVPVENSLMFAAALSKHNVLFDLHVFTKGKHGLGLAEEEEHTNGWTDVCASWLAFNGFK